MLLSSILLIFLTMAATKTTTTATTKAATTAPPQSFIYIRSDALKGCTTGKRVTTREECIVARDYFRSPDGRPAVMKEKTLALAPSGCYYYVAGRELHFNYGHTDLKKLFAGDELICKVPGTGLGLHWKGICRVLHHFCKNPIGICNVLKRAEKNLPRIHNHISTWSHLSSPRKCIIFVTINCHTIKEQRLHHHRRPRLPRPKQQPKVFFTLLVFDFRWTYAVILTPTLTHIHAGTLYTHAHAHARMKRQLPSSSP